MNGKLGSLDAPIFFVNHRDPAHEPGYIMLAAYSEQPTPEGYSREYAEDLPSVDRLQKRLQDQEFRHFDAEANRDLALIQPRLKKIYDNLRTRMCSGSCTPYERDFIEGYLKLLDEKREKHRRNFECRAAYLHAREFDLPNGRQANEESFNSDRHEVK